MKTLKPIWYTKTSTASRMRQFIERILDWAEVQGLRKGDNPATWKLIKHLLPAQTKVAQATHHPALPWTEIGDFVRQLRNDTATASRALEFLILTATRSDETLGARWNEIDLDNKVWVIPAPRMKTRKEHRVPLSNPAMILLREQLVVAGNPFVFPGFVSGKKLSPTMMQLKVRETNNDITVHGFRSTFRDWAADTTNVAREVVEQALAHTVGNQVEAAYRRTDLFEKRRHLMEAWGEFVMKPPAQVVQLRAAE